MASSSGALSARLQSGGKGITRANRVGVEKACLAGKTVMLAGLRAAGASGALRGVGRSGSKVGVRYDVKGFQNPVGIISYRGQVHLLNNPTRAHEIRPRSRGGRMAISPKGSPWTKAVAQHPGTSGKKFHEKSEPIVIAQSKRIITAEVRGHLARTFAGR